jgi:DNA-binding CsgD family transcriptional regulator
VARVWADGFLGALGYYRDRWYHGIAHLTRALDLARRLDDPEALWWTAFLWLWYGQAPQYADDQLGLAEEFATRPRTGVSTRTLAMTLTWVGDSFLNRGRRRAAEAAWHDLTKLAEHSGQPIIQLNVLRTAAALATLDGRLEEALALGRRMLVLGDESGLPEYARIVASLTSQRALLYLGRADEALRLSYSEQMRTLPLAHLGDTAAVVQHLDQAVMARPMFEIEADDTTAFSDVFRLEAAVLVGHEAATARLVDRLARSGHVTTGTRVSTCTHRHLGAALALLGRAADARAHYLAALDHASTIGFRAEAALSHLGLAELLLAQTPPEYAAARHHLATAIPELTSMGMKPALAQARSLLARTRTSGVSRASQTRSDGLTAREVEVLQLLAAGHSNREIAAVLVVSPRTAEHHIASIYAKIGAHGRADATAYALRHSLLPTTLGADATGSSLDVGGEPPRQDR